MDTFFINMTELIIIILFYILSAYWYGRIFFAVGWLRSKRSAAPAAAPAQPGFIIIIPVLDEADIIKATVDYFLELLRPFGSGSRLVIVTTEKEFALPAATGRAGKPAKRLNTIEALASCRSDQVLALHYPGRAGRMAHQLNFALQHLRQDGIWQDQLLGIYNADSRPEPETLAWISGKAVRGEGRVFQQFGNYFGNAASLVRQDIFSRAVLFSSSAWQNRWSLGFEIFNAWKQSLFRRIGSSSLRLWYPLNYCIGHGLFFTRQACRQFQGFSETTYNEDAILGLELSCRREQIVPVPYFDYSDSPNQIKSLFRQKAAWFQGPFQAPRYYRILAEAPKGLERWQLLILTVKLFFHAIFWLAGPSLIIWLLGRALWSGNFFPFLGVYLVFLVLPNFFGFLATKGKIKIKAVDAFIYILIGSLFAYILHGSSAYYAVALSIRSALTKREIIKYKTAILRD